MVGERGSKLSGGQKARISLARGLYQDRDIVLLDDPLSSVDYTTRKTLFHEAICGFAKDKTRVLVTHATEFLHLADRVVVMKNGGIESIGVR